MLDHYTTGLHAFLLQAALFMARGLKENFFPNKRSHIEHLFLSVEDANP
jgi:hypothetical protein